MPRLYHRKSTTGCTQCKQRRVKCNEAKPVCRDCQRHELPCHYRAQPQPQPTSSHDSTTTIPDNRSRSSEHCAGVLSEDTSHPARTPEYETLAVVLLHYFLTVTTSHFHDPIVLWTTRLPLVGFKWRYVMDALLSLASLDLYRHTFAGHESSTTTMSRRGNNNSLEVYSLSIGDSHHQYLHGYSPKDMQRISHTYFESAIEGHRKAVQHLDLENFEAAFLASTAIYMNALYALGCPHETGLGEGDVIYDEKLWFSLATGCQEIVRSWNHATGANALRVAGYFDMDPDFSAEEQLFYDSNQHVFATLLIYGKDFELTTSAEDKTYEQAVNFLGLIFTGVRDDTQPIKVIGSYIASFAAKLRPPFQRLVSEGRPRALVIVAQLFAIMSLVEDRLPQYSGIGARQVPAIYERLPQAWKRTMAWASSIVVREIDSQEPLPYPPSIDDLNRT